MLLTVHDLSVTFGDRAVVRNVSLSIAAGECLALIGASGSGKSVIARAILGLAGDAAIVSAAQLRLGDTDLTKLGEREWRAVRGGRIGLVLQDALASLDPARTIGRELDDAIRLHAPGMSATARRERAVALLTQVGLPAPQLRLTQRAGALSGGQRQRALIAIALAGNPDVLIADEPTTALDAHARRELLLLLRALADQGLGILFISHDLAAVRLLSDRIAVIDKGAIVETAATATLLRDATSEEARALVAAIPRAPRAAAPVAGTPVLACERVSVTFPLPDGTSVAALRDVSIAVAAGETLGVVGESGSGKSTLARVLLGLQPSSTGAVTLGERPWSAMTERQRRPLRSTLGWIAQDALSGFDPRLRVGAILADARSHGRTRSARRERAGIAALLHEVGLEAHVAAALPRHLSGGQRQRVAIARALAGEPEVLIADEAVSALDAVVRRQILTLLQRIRDDRGLACVFIGHDLDVVAEISDRIAVLDRGEVAEVGPTVRVFSEPQSAAAKRLLGVRID